LEAQLAAIDAAVARDPNNAARWNSRGSLLAGMGRPEEALSSFDRALSIQPHFAEALCNRATLLLETHKLDAALGGFDAVLAIEPSLAIGWNNRGNTLSKMQRFEDAIVSYERALAIRPEFPEARENRDFALFALGRNTRSPSKYMRGLFDEFSSHYDNTMLEKLHYRAHLHVRAMAARVLPHSAPWRILDLGCGTGLLGTVFQDLAPGGRLDGIDISPRMMDGARARGLFGELILGDLETVLAEPGPSYDLIISADTMTYFGDLAPAFAGVVKRLEPGGFCLFASEAKTGEAWEQTKVHRFRHSEAYLRAEASRAGLEFVDIVECTLRHEENEPVCGFAVALRKPAEHLEGTRRHWPALRLSKKDDGVCANGVVVEINRARLEPYYLFDLEMPRAVEAQFVEAELVDMGGRQRDMADAILRRRQDGSSSRLQDAVKFGEIEIDIVHMFDGLHADHDVKRLGGKAHGRHILA
jgi:predicted TPR repeat methyltransferase